MIKNVIRYAFYILQVYIFYSLSQLLIFENTSFTPLAIICVFLSVCIFENKVTSVLFGILLGFIVDLSLGDVLGINSAFLGILGYLLNSMYCNFLNPNSINFAIISGLTTACAVRLSIFVNSYLASKSIYLISSKNIIIATLVVAIPIYLFNKFITNFLTENKNGKCKYQ